MVSPGVFLGPLIFSEQREHVTVIEDGILAVKDGKIVLVESLGGRNVDDVLDKLGVAGPRVTLQPGQILIPGFVDTHIHAPQFPNAGLGYDKTLLDWLTTYTFPMESRYSDTNFAARVYDAVVRQTLDAGTTLACYFATIHVKSCLALAQSAVRGRQRALIGKVNMDVNSPEWYIETLEESINGTKNFVEAVEAMKSDLVKPVITPRFAISCDMPLMKQLGSLARERQLHVQTHISENKDEVIAVQNIYPNSANYTAVYDEAGLLGQKTILAHGVHLKDEELRVMALRGSALAHCPLSNTCLRSGMCDVRRALQAGVRVGLGTDVSGGPSPSILDVIRGALDTSIHISFSKEPDYVPLSYHEVFFLATLGGAQALAMDDCVGNFKVGKELDALLVTAPNHDSTPIQLNTLQTLQKFLYCGSKEDIKQVYVKGQAAKS